MISPLAKPEDDGVVGAAETKGRCCANHLGDGGLQPFDTLSDRTSHPNKTVLPWFTMTNLLYFVLVFLMIRDP